MWCQNGDKMSPENQGVFQLLKDGTFRRILTFYNSRKWGHFWGASCVRTGHERLVGPVLEITASLCNNKGLNVLCFPGKTRRGSFDYIEAWKCFGFAVVGPQGINCPCELECSCEVTKDWLSLTPLYVRERFTVRTLGLNCCYLIASRRAGI